MGRKVRGAYALKCEEMAVSYRSFIAYDQEGWCIGCFMCIFTEILKSFSTHDDRRMRLEKYR
jgi:hypothetical protein